MSSTRSGLIETRLSRDHQVSASGYLETSFLPLRSFEGIEDLQAQHDTWAAEVAFRRHHRRVGAKVGDAWMTERGFLAPLPDPLPDTDRRVEVRSPKTGFAGWEMSTIRCLQD